MPTYKQTSKFFEPGFGWVFDVFLVSDTYEGLGGALDEATEVGIFEVESTKHDLDIDAGTMVEDEIGFKVDARMIGSADDLAALALVLEANDREVLRFCARLINPSATPLPEEFEFRGRIRTDMSADDLRWSGSEWSGAIAPLRDWSFSASSVDAGHILDADLGKLVHGVTEGEAEGVGRIDDAWIAANVKDRMGYLYVDEDDFGGLLGYHGHREARWGNLVGFHELTNKLLQQAAPDGITISYESVPAGVYARPARFIPYVDPGSGEATRYCNRFVGGNPAPYNAYPDDEVPLRIGGNEGTIGSMYVSWRLLDPTSEENGASWLRYDSLADLLYAIGACFGAYLTFDYVSNSEIIVRYRSRDTLGTNETFLRDAVKAAISTKALSVTEARKKRWVAAGTETLTEGPDRQYNYDGGFAVTREVDRAPTEGEKLALSLNPAWCFLQNRGNDAGVDFTGGGAIIPHNVRFWKKIGGTLQKEAEGTNEKDRATLHTAIYVRTTGVDYDGSVGVTGIPVWAPLHSITVRRPAGSGTIVSRYDRLAAYINDIYGTDQSYYDNEYTITVPGLNGFRAAVDGPMSWRHVALGNKITLDGVLWVVVGIERKRRETDLRLHNASRFDLTAEAGITAPTITPPNISTPGAGAANVVGRECGETIAQFDLVTLKADGKIYKAKARHEHYGGVLGIALSAGSAGQQIEVQTSGRVATGSAFAFASGTPLYLRTEGAGLRNIRSTPLTAKTVDEDMYASIGTADSGGGILLSIAPQYVYYPPLEDE